MKTNKFLVIGISIMVIMAMLLAGCASAKTTISSTTYSSTYTQTYTTQPNVTKTITAATTYTQSSTYTGKPNVTVTATTTSGGYSPPSTSTIGLATGGAKDVTSFRDNIFNNYLPLPTDVTYEGLFYDYYFDTGTEGETSTKLFYPSYSYAVTRDPISQQTDYYLSVGLNSGLREEDFQRKPLNLVIVLDISGSMGESFNRYYYDANGNQIDAYADEGVNRPTKMDSATEAVVAILNQLNADDNFAIVLFNQNAQLVKPMGRVSQTNMNDIKNRVLDLNAGGSTNLDAGMDVATDQFRKVNTNDYKYENRVIVCTDAQPNTGDISSGGLAYNVTRNAENRIYTSFVGIGLDFNSQLIELMTKTKGANYYVVHSPKEFRTRMNEEFDYMVTPLIFNVRLNFASQGWRIDQVFGSPEADASTGSLMTINTLFPSKSEGGENKGGLVLLKLRKITSQPDEKIYLKVTYEDRYGRLDGSESAVYLEGTSPEYFGNSGIRKGILLSRYAALLKNWMIDEREHLQQSAWNPCIDERTGISIPSETTGQWERTSLPLTVSYPYKQLFSKFKAYFSNEMYAIGDQTLSQEWTILDRLSR